MRWSNFFNQGNRPEKRRYHDDMDEYLAREKRKMVAINFAFAMAIIAAIIGTKVLFNLIF